VAPTEIDAMEIGQINNLANQAMPERRNDGQSPQAARPSARGETNLARALVADDLSDAALPAKDLRLSVDRDLERVVARIIDNDSGEVVREVPPEELVELAKTLRSLMGQLLDRRA
jgi:flagellar protein FlaG